MYFQGYCVSFKQALAVIPIFEGTELIHKSSCSHPLNELYFSYYEREIAATYSFKFTVFLQKRKYSKRSICQGHCVYFTTLVATIHYSSIVSSGLRLIRKKIKCMFIWGKPLQPCSFKGTYLFNRASCNNFFWKVLC